MKAIIEEGRVIALVSGDIACGVELPVGLPVTAGWRYTDDTFSAPAESGTPLDACADAERRWRMTALIESDWLVTRHRDETDAATSTTLNSKQFLKLLAYRQALRDWPGGNEAADAESRPNPPKWLAHSSS